MKKLIMTAVVIIVILFGVFLLMNSNNSKDEAGSSDYSKKITPEQAAEAEEIDLQTTDDDFSALDASLNSLE